MDHSPDNDLPGHRRTLINLATDRLNGLPSWVILTQLFIGFGWLRAVAEKIVDPGWWTGDVIRRFVQLHEDAALPWYRPFLNHVVLPAAPLIAVTVVILQLTAGLSLASGRRLGIGLTVGIWLNLQFLASGAVTPSAFYLLAQGSLALWLAENALTRTTVKRLVAVVALTSWIAVLNLPFISTIQPHEVIEDPAVMFVFGGALTVVSCLVAVRTYAQGTEATPAATEAGGTLIMSNVSHRR